MTAATKEVILDQDQLGYLQLIYKRKQRLLIRGGGGAILLWLLLTGTRLPRIMQAYTEEPAHSKLVAGLITIIFFTGLLAGTCVLIYYKNLLPLKKDIQQKSGLITYKTITGKMRMPVREDYFLYFDDRKMRYKQILKEEFLLYKVGDQYPVLTAARSNIQVDGFWNYSLF